MGKNKKDEKKKEEEEQRQKEMEQSSKASEAGTETKADEPAESETGSKGKRKDDARKKQKFFKAELKRIRKALEQEQDKIVKPKPQPHKPDVFTSLKPYSDVYTARVLIDLPYERHSKYVTKHTAQSLIDPWESYKLDTHPLPPIEVKHPPENSDEEYEEEEEKKEDKTVKFPLIEESKKTPRKEKHEGSTRLPKFPAVQVAKGTYAKKQLYYSDVPMLRQELRDKYSNNAERRVQEEYKRTKDDFYRMELDKLDEYHPANRPKMRAAYFAYLQNTPGSKKAVYECVRASTQDKSPRVQRADKQSKAPSVASQA